MSEYKFSDLCGRSISKVEATDDVVTLYTDNGTYRLFHSQDCCEHVYLADVVGDWSDVVGSPLLQAEEVSSVDAPPAEEYAESYTWTYYKLATIKGSLTMRWYGSSNGYYSESVDFCRMDP